MILSMVNAVDSYAFDGSFVFPYLDIFRAHHEKAISQRRGSSSAVMQLFFSNLTAVSVRALYMAMVL
jgi:hypothetical protein